MLPRTWFGAKSQLTGHVRVCAPFRFAADCGQAYRRASHKTRRLFNAAVLDRLEVRDRKLAGVAYQPPFDLLFSRNGFEYDTVVDPTSQHANRLLVVEGPTIRL